jgi:peptidoglycan hydrolase FlgJ
MVDKILNDTRVYTDVQGLSQLQSEYRKNPEAAKTEIAQQFASMLMQMVMRSMREANKTFDSGLLNSDQMDFYQDMYDKQLALTLSSSGIGIANEIKKNMDQQFHLGNAGEKSSAPATQEIGLDIKASPVHPQFSSPHQEKLLATPSTSDKNNFDSPADFVKTIWPYAKQAANLLGVDPKLLIAQAALETNWGKKIIGNETSSHNLFNIKASSDWNKKTVMASTLEEKNGVLVKEHARFKKYDSYQESFTDFVDTLKSHARYTSVQSAQNPQKFTQALQAAGFATDKNYAAKIMSVFDSPLFKHLMSIVGVSI